MAADKIAACEQVSAGQAVMEEIDSESVGGSPMVAVAKRDACEGSSMQVGPSDDRVATKKNVLRSVGVGDPPLADRVTPEVGPSSPSFL